MTTTVKINLRDVTTQFFKDLKATVGESAVVEITVAGSSSGEELFSQNRFRAIIDLFDWKQKKAG